MLPYRLLALIFAAALPLGTAIAAPTPEAVAQYQKSVDRQLFNQFGNGLKSRELYCDGPAIIGFEILPNGRTANVRILHHTLPGIDARLVNIIGNMKFRPLPSGMAGRPYVTAYSYGVPGYDLPLLKQRFDCR